MTANTILTATQTLDNRGSDCAAGFVSLLEIMDTLRPGETLRILSTDPASQRELREWADRSGHTILNTEKSGPFWHREYHYLIRKETTHRYAASQMNEKLGAWSDRPQRADKLSALPQEEEP